MTGEQRAVSEKPTEYTPDWLLGCFQKVLGHELSNNLVATQGLLRLLELEEGAHLSEEGRDYLRRLSAGTERTQALISCLADIVRAVRRVEPPQPVPLTETLHELAAAMKHQLSDRSPAFQFDILVDALRVPPGGFRQVLTQVFRWAILSNGPGNPPLAVRAVTSAAGVELGVTQSGPGLSPAQQERLFDPASGGANSLGLVLARALVETWGGSLVVQCQERGNTLRIWLPQ